MHAEVVWKWSETLSAAIDRLDERIRKS
jgi:hypothetical protein